MEYELAQVAYLDCTEQDSSIKEKEAPTQIKTPKHLFDFYLLFVMEGLRFTQFATALKTKHEQCK